LYNKKKAKEKWVRKSSFEVELLGLCGGDETGNCTSRKAVIILCRRKWCEPPPSFGLSRRDISPGGEGAAPLQRFFSFCVLAPGERGGFGGNESRRRRGWGNGGKKRENGLHVKLGGKEPRKLVKNGSDGGRKPLLTQNKTERNETCPKRGVSLSGRGSEQVLGGGSKVGRRNQTRKSVRARGTVRKRRCPNGKKNGKVWGD